MVRAVRLASQVLERCLAQIERKCVVSASFPFPNRRFSLIFFSLFFFGLPSFPAFRTSSADVCVLAAASIAPARNTPPRGEWQRGPASTAAEEGQHLLAGEGGGGERLEATLGHAAHLEG